MYSYQKALKKLKKIINSILNIKKNVSLEFLLNHHIVLKPKNTN